MSQNTADTAGWTDLGGGWYRAEPGDASGRLGRVQRVARLMDGAVRIPIINLPIGLDALFGLIPVVGDAITTLVGLWIVREAARMGAPRGLLLRMVGNLAVDLVAGSVPVIGDLIDVAFRANMRNAALLEAWVAGRW